MSSPLLAGRTALVSGAGNGLGRAMVAHLTRAGVRVVLVGRDPWKLAETRDLLGLSEVESRLETCDVSDPHSVATLAHRVANEAVSILVNNAGVAGPVANLVSVTPEDWDLVFATNVRGVYLMCRAFLPPMTEARHGDVVNVASVSGKRPLPRRTPYCASKMAVIGLTATLATEVGAFNVRVNSLSPGPVRGPRMARNLRLEAESTGTSQDDAEAAMVARAALGRMLEEDEVGQALVAMLQMSGMTGADIDLSAGMVAR